MLYFSFVVFTALRGGEQVVGAEVDGASGDFIGETGSPVFLPPSLPPSPLSPSPLLPLPFHLLLSISPFLPSGICQKPTTCHALFWALGMSSEQADKI